MNQGAGPGSEPRVEAWREALRKDERRRGRRPRDQRATLRSLTISTAVAAATLNVILFVQAGIEQSGPADFQNAIISALSGLFPHAGLQSSSQTPAPAPGATPIAVSGGS